MNETELIDLARLSIDHDWQIRFIEIMPVENQQEWGEGFPQAEERFISMQEIKTLLMDLNLELVKEPNNNGPARVLQIPGAKGTIGFISPVGEHFCGECNRLRLTADGNLKPCLLHSLEIPLREALRRGDDITPLLTRAVLLKPIGHTLKDMLPDTHRTMSQIGG
jgi:cyclic pyranopterin phosphate synthase